jgi:hypothetical protein
MGYLPPRGHIIDSSRGQVILILKNSQRVDPRLRPCRKSYAARKPCPSALLHFPIRDFEPSILKETTFQATSL